MSDLKTLLALSLVKENANVRFTPVCGRLRVGKNFFHVCSIGRCARVFGL